MASGIAGGGRRAGDAPPRLGLQGFRPAAFAPLAVPPRCFCGSWSSQSCAKRTSMLNTTERFPVLTGTGTRLHQTGFRMSRIAACTTCCQWTAREVANDLCVRESSHHISNPWTTQASSNNNTRTAGISKFKMGSTYLLLSAFIVVTRRLRLRKRASHKDYVQGRRQAASSPL